MKYAALALFIVGVVIATKYAERGLETLPIAIGGGVLALIGLVAFGVLWFVGL